MTRLPQLGAGCPISRRDLGFIFGIEPIRGNGSSGSGPAPQLSFNTGNNEITNTGYTYDAAGDLTSDGIHSYSYDADGNLIQVDGSVPRNISIMLSTSASRSKQEGMVRNLLST